MIRAQFRDPDHFDRTIKFYGSVIGKRLTELADLNDQGKAGSTYDILDYSVRLMISRYSRGDAIADIHSSVLKMVKMLELQRSTLASVQLDKDVRQMYERLDLGRLYESLTLLAFLISLRPSTEDILHVLTLIGHAGEDALLDQVAHALGDVSRKISPYSKFPKIYDSLAEVISASAGQRSALLKKFVEGWYKRMKPIYWHNSHEEAEGAYFGYWCFEAALVAMLLEIDDSELADHPHYPSDLVNYYRSPS